MNKRISNTLRDKMDEITNNESIESVEITEQVNNYNNAEEKERVPVQTMLTVQEASRLTNLAPSAIRRICYENKCVSIKIGKKVIINEQSLMRYLAKGD